MNHFQNLVLIFRRGIRFAPRAARRAWRRRAINQFKARHLMQDSFQSARR